MILRSDFGMTPCVPLVGGQVELAVSGAFERAAGASAACRSGIDGLL